MAEYYCYITPSHGKIGVLNYHSDDSSDNWSKFTGSVKIIVDKHDAALTTDTGPTGTPAFSTNYHMALVYGTLFLMGYKQYEPYWKDFIKRAKSTKSGRGVYVVKQWTF